MSKRKVAKPAEEAGNARHLRLKAAGICTACGKRRAPPRLQSRRGEQTIPYR